MTPPPSTRPSPEPLAFASAQAGLVRRGVANRLGWAAVLGVFGPLLGNWIYRAATGVAAPETVTSALVFCAIFSIFVVLPAAATMAWLKPRRSGDLVANDEGITMATGAKRRRIERAAIVSGLWVPATAPHVELALRGGDALSLSMPDEGSAQRLLERLGLDASRRRVAVTAGQRTPASVWMAFTSVAALFVTGDAAKKTALAVQGSEEVIRTIWVLGALMLGYVVARWVTPDEVVVGGDGLSIRGTFGTRFVSYADIEHVEPADDGRIAVRLSAGGVVWVGSRTLGAAHRAALIDRIHRAMGSGADETIGELRELDRQDRSFETWRDAAGRLMRGAAGYRGSLLERRQVVAALSNPQLSAERRIGAALALAGAGELDAEARGRLRVAADTTVAPRLRLALERFAEGAIDARAIEEALAEEQAAASTARLDAPRR